MKCANCPLHIRWDNENDRGESCGLFGDTWDAPFLYLDKEGNIGGCYIDRHFIKHIKDDYMKELDMRVQYFLEEELKRAHKDPVPF